MKHKVGVLLAVSKEDLPIILQWRNSDVVRPFMINNCLITQEEHYRWFNSLDSEQNCCLIFLYDNRPVGYVGFTEINDFHERCQWGFYLGESDLPPGTGYLMGRLAMDYAFNQLKLNRVYSYILPNNERSINYHKKLGFLEEGYLKGHVKRDGKYEDLIMMALIKNNWKTLKE